MREGLRCRGPPQLVAAGAPSVGTVQASSLEEAVGVGHVAGKRGKELGGHFAIIDAVVGCRVGGRGHTGSRSSAPSQLLQATAHVPVAAGQCVWPRHAARGANPPPAPRSPPRPT